MFSLFLWLCFHFIASVFVFYRVARRDISVCVVEFMLVPVGGESKIYARHQTCFLSIETRIILPSYSDASCRFIHSHQLSAGVASCTPSPSISYPSPQLRSSRTPVLSFSDPEVKPALSYSFFSTLTPLPSPYFSIIYLHNISAGLPPLPSAHHSTSRVREVSFTGSSISSSTAHRQGLSHPSPVFLPSRPPVVVSPLVDPPTTLQRRPGFFHLHPTSAHSPPRQPPSHQRRDTTYQSRQLIYIHFGKLHLLTFVSFLSINLHLPLESVLGSLECPVLENPDSLGSLSSIASRLFQLQLIHPHICTLSHTVLTNSLTDHRHHGSHFQSQLQVLRGPSTTHPRYRRRPPRDQVELQG